MTQKHTFFRILLLAFVAIGSVQAQDLHYTQFDAAPLQLNPALTGGFAGTARIGFIYRDQWNYLANVRGYRTPLIYVDAPILPGLRKQDWIGVGINLFQDQAGSSGLTRSSMGVSAAYHIGLDKAGKTTLAVGASYGFFSRGLRNRDRLILEDQLINGGQSVDIQAIANENVSYTDLGAGARLGLPLNDRMRLSLGASFNHLLRPDYNIIQNQVARMPLLMTIHGNFEMDINSRISIAPQVMHQRIASSSETLVQAIGAYQLNPGKSMKLRGGLGYRISDAVQLLVGVEQGPLRAGIAYDVNVSSFSTASRGHGGFEVYANYIIRIPKSIKVDPVILCPRF